MAAAFTAEGLKTRRAVSNVRTPSGGADVETVAGVRPGLSSRQIVLVAQRDATSTPAKAELSGTAALLEFARVFKLRTLQKTLVLVSTSGLTGGGSAGAVAKLVGDPKKVDAVILLGDIASKGGPKPWVIPWSNGLAQSPPVLRQTIEAAIKRETGQAPGSIGGFGQSFRRALPLTASQQGDLVANGLPAAMLQATGERGPTPNSAVSAEVFGGLGRSIMRAVTAIDSRKPSPIASAHKKTPEGIAVGSKLLPDWCGALLVASLLLPVLLCSLDGFVRVCRRRSAGGSLLWVSANLLPFLLTFGWLRLVGAIGGINATQAPVLPDPPPFSWLSGLVICSTVGVFALAWFGLRRLLLARSTAEEVVGGGAAITLTTVFSLVTVALWFMNPYAAALMVPAAHITLLSESESLRSSRAFRWFGVIIGLLPFLIACSYYLIAFQTDPFAMGWSLFNASAGGYLSVFAAVVIAVFFTTLLSTVLLARSEREIDRRRPPNRIATRGPLSYAGPGSLGGTSSAIQR
jgi:hypothetical protein